MNAKQVVNLARKHLGGGGVNVAAGNESSARLCLTDAVKLYDAGNLTDAKTRAIKSLAYSVGIHHRDYVRAAK